jgi:hypothetical protein
MIVRTTLGSAAIWHRIRIAAETVWQRKPCAQGYVRLEQPVWSSAIDLGCGSRARSTLPLVRADARTYGCPNPQVKEL